MGDRIDVDLPSSPYDLQIILVGIKHPGNLGAVCRAMLNHGFTNLRLVEPKCQTDDQEARNRAKHAGMILDNAQIFESIDDCIADCSLVVGTSGKREVGSKVLSRHFVLPWELAGKLRDYTGTVGLVFGEEGKGLSTDLLEKCDFLLTLPTWDGYPIANLSQAVGHCVYELHRDRVKNGLNILGVDQERNLDSSLRQILKQSISEFGSSLSINKSQLVTEVFERIIMRSLPNDQEAERLLGAIIEATTALQNVKGDDDWIRNKRKRIIPAKSPKTSESL
ncbi:MAG: RNA methyltransferase [Candidatus Poseidoniales archaeon]